VALLIALLMSLKYMVSICILPEGYLNYSTVYIVYLLYININFIYMCVCACVRACVRACVCVYNILAYANISICLYGYVYTYLLIDTYSHYKQILILMFILVNNMTVLLQKMSWQLNC